MALQESLEEGYKADYPTIDGSIHPDFFEPCITCCRRTARTCWATWASRDRVESRRQDPSNFIALSAPRPLKVEGSNFVAAILRCPLHKRPLRRRPPAGHSRRGAPSDGDPGPAEVAVSAPISLKLRRTDPPLPPAQAAAGAGAAAPSNAAGEGARGRTCGK